MSFFNSDGRIDPSPVSSFDILHRLNTIAQDREVFNLCLGQPNFDPPAGLREAGSKAFLYGDLSYHQPPGLSDARATAARKFKRDNGLTCDESQIFIGNGLTGVLYHALRVICKREPGCKILIPVPAWECYGGIVEEAGGSPDFIKTDPKKGFKLQPEALDKAIGPETRGLIFNSPGNPSGATYSESEIFKLTEVLDNHPKVWVFSDDIYEHFIYDGTPFATMAKIAEGTELARRIVTCNATSKAYATGVRIGYAAAEENMIREMARIFVNNGFNTSVPTQMAAMGALEGPQEFLIGNRQIMEARFDAAVKVLGNAYGLECWKPQAGFYVWGHCGGLIDPNSPIGLINDSAVAKDLLETVGVGVIPGANFNLSPYLRISLANDNIEQITYACERIVERTNEIRELHRLAA